MELPVLGPLWPRSLVQSNSCRVWFPGLIWPRFACFILLLWSSLPLVVISVLLLWSSLSQAHSISGCSVLILCSSLPQAPISVFFAFIWNILSVGHPIFVSAQRSYLYSNILFYSCVKDFCLLTNTTILGLLMTILSTCYTLKLKALALCFLTQDISFFTMLFNHKSIRKVVCHLFCNYTNYLLAFYFN